jgi:tripartite-type tricarboxylate transporter receptor subunit TctC
MAIALGTPAQAAYPERPVTIIVAWTAGGATDLLTRGLQDVFQKAIGGQIVVKNVPGAAGTLGTAEAAAARHRTDIRSSSARSGRSRCSLIA